MFSQLVNNESWTRFFANSQVYHCALENGSIVKHVQVERTAAIIRTENYMKNEALESKTKMCDFFHVIKKFSNSKTVRKNADQRLFWKVDNVYLVKRFFTFGFLTPKSAITISNGKAEMDIYIAKHHSFDIGYLPLSSHGFTRYTLLPDHEITLTQPFILLAKRICIFKLECHNDVSEFTFCEQYPRLSIDNEYLVSKECIELYNSVYLD